MERQNPVTIAILVRKKLVERTYQIRNHSPRVVNYDNQNVIRPGTDDLLPMLAIRFWSYVSTGTGPLLPFHSHRPHLPRTSASLLPLLIDTVLASGGVCRIEDQSVIQCVGSNINHSVPLRIRCVLAVLNHEREFTATELAARRLDVCHGLDNLGGLGTVRCDT